MLCNVISNITITQFPFTKFLEKAKNGKYYILQPGESYLNTIDTFII